MLFASLPAHIHLNRIEGFTGHGIFALNAAETALHLFDLGNRQIFIQHILPNNTATTVSRIAQVLPDLHPAGDAGSSADSPHASA